MSDNTEWLIEFKDNSYFRLSENKFYIKNQKNYEVCQDNNEKNYGGMKEMDFCYCHDMHIDLIECKKSDSPSKRALREDCTDKALHSSALLKTALNNNITQQQEGNEGKIVKIEAISCTVSINLEEKTMLKADSSKMYKVVVKLDGPGGLVKTIQITQNS